MRRVAVVRHDEAVALPQGDRPTVPQFEGQLALHDVQNVPTVAPMIGEVACFVLHEPKA